MGLVWEEEKMVWFREWSHSNIWFMECGMNMKKKKIFFTSSLLVIILLMQIWIFAIQFNYNWKRICDFKLAIYESNSWEIETSDPRVTCQSLRETISL